MALLNKPAGQPDKSGYFTKFCGLLRKYELYYTMQKIEGYRISWYQVEKWRRWCEIALLVGVQIKNFGTLHFLCVSHLNVN